MGMPELNWTELMEQAPFGVVEDESKPDVEPENPEEEQ
jgi:hypothetical protein